MYIINCCEWTNIISESGLRELRISLSDLAEINC